MSAESQLPPERFIRTAQLIGAKQLANLHRARVAVVGLGAVGSYTVEALARAGVGALLLVDNDTVQYSNFNRQLYALESTLGRSKTAIAQARVLDINPACKVETHQLFVDATNAGTLLQSQPDVVIDAIDSVASKVALLAAAARAGLPVISVMGAASRRDPGLVRVADISVTRRCPLARFVRKKLRQHGVYNGICCLYSDEPPPRVTASPEPLERGRARRPVGSLSYMPGIFGLWAAGLALEILLSKSPPQQ